MIKTILNDLAEVCVKHSRQIVTAESCTGGLVAKLVTDLAGSSQWFERGFVSYSNLAKEEMLGVDKQLIRAHGAVSESVAEAMARGALIHSQAQFSLSITGIAGPDGGTARKPVGTVCFGWAQYKLNTSELVTQTSEQHFTGNREAVRDQSALFALQNILEIIKQNPKK